MLSWKYVLYCKKKSNNPSIKVIFIHLSYFEVLSSKNLIFCNLSIHRLPGHLRNQIWTRYINNLLLHQQLQNISHIRNHRCTIREGWFFKSELFLCWLWCCQVPRAGRLPLLPAWLRGLGLLPAGHQRGGGAGAARHRGHRPEDRLLREGVSAGPRLRGDHCCLSSVPSTPSLSPLQRAWVFERAVGYLVEGHDDRVIAGVASRRECEELCLLGTGQFRTVVFWILEYSHFV